MDDNSLTRKSFRIESVSKYRSSFNSWDSDIAFKWDLNFLEGNETTKIKKKRKSTKESNN